MGTRNIGSFGGSLKKRILDGIGFSLFVAFAIDGTRS